jgi:hypothetical protein
VRVQFRLADLTPQEFIEMVCSHVEREARRAGQEFPRRFGISKDELLRIASEYAGEHLKDRRPAQGRAKGAKRSRDRRSEKARNRNARLDAVLRRVATDDAGAWRPLDDVVESVKGAGLQSGRSKVAERLRILKAKSTTETRARRVQP